MDKFDLADTLVQYGVSDDDAQKLKGEISGDDLMDLISYLKNNGQGVQLNKASDILGKYGITLRSKKDMDNYLGAKYESLQQGKELDETFGMMSPLAEAFTYAVEVNDQTRDRVLDWLDENQVNYQATSPTNYRIECGDRDVAYRTGRALSEILRKPTVRDSVEIEEKMSKNPDKRVKAAKAKMADIKPRNPVVAAVKTRSGAGAHDGGKDPRKVDKFGRGAKHKPRFDEEIESDNLNEGVMGMKPVNPLFRLRELAGLPMNGLDEDDFDGIEIPEVPQTDPDGPLAPGPVDMDDSSDNEGGMMDTGLAGGMDDLASEDTPSDLDEPSDDMDDMNTLDNTDDVNDLADNDIGAITPSDAGVPGDLGSDPVEAVPGMDPMMPTQSDAMSQIEDALNSIQSGLADIRLSEYKSLIQKLQDLTNQAQMMGRDYLGERFERRRK